jgi:hypothetical protein
MRYISFLPFITDKYIVRVNLPDQLIPFIFWSIVTNVNMNENLCTTIIVIIIIRIYLQTLM